MQLENKANWNNKYIHYIFPVHSNLCEGIQLKYSTYMQLENKANWNNKYIHYMAALNKYYTLDEILLTDQAELRFN